MVAVNDTFDDDHDDDKCVFCVDVYWFLFVSGNDASFFCLNLTLKAGAKKKR